MKFLKISIFLNVFNFIIFFAIFFFANLSEKIQKENNRINLDLNSLNNILKLNKLELSAHLNPNYLKKLEKIYLNNTYTESLNIVDLNNESFFYIEKVIRAKTN
ncbi:MAG: hypothetical protein CFH19_00663 [Alphaproteobacteria bacterium MarineAlpha5_Bin9]|nr:MAG: hypothetical protein CFH19_00663 [Alphaproteobacteria bacterium MarineAlpha5_Bin9]|tara:strand:- start:15918 stop:16229 length:312 start_codon:yes stop_codon:yes gene_type:complete